MAESLQKRISAWGRERFGATNDNPQHRMTKFLDEFKELGYAFLDWKNFSTPENTAELRSELADCYLCLLALAESLHMDLEAISEAKMQELLTRVYEQDSEGNYVKVRR